MKMLTFGHIAPSSRVHGDFELYVQCLEQFVVANDLDAIALFEDQSNQTAIDSRDAKCCAILLTNLFIVAQYHVPW